MSTGQRHPDDSSRSRPHEVAVLLPVYNNEATCTRALAAMQNQTWPHLQIIVVDDGSDDGSLRALQRQAGQDSRVTIVRRPHRGIVPALNAGLERTRSPFVARMDADDDSAPERIATQMEVLLADPRIGAVDCRVGLGRSDVTGAGMEGYVRWLNSLHGWPALKAALFEESPLVHPAVTMRRQALDAAGGYQDVSGPEDYSLWLRMVGAGYHLAKVLQELFTWTDGPQRLTRTDDRYSLRRMWALKVEHLPAIVPRVRDGVQVWGAGQTGRRFMGFLREAGIPIRRIIDIDPRKIGRDLHGSPIVSLAELPLHRDTLCLVALGQRRAKAQVHEHLAQLGWRNGLDYLVVT